MYSLPDIRDQVKIFYSLTQQSDSECQVPGPKCFLTLCRIQGKPLHSVTTTALCLHTEP